MDTITLSTDDEVRRMSYAEIAEMRGVSVAAAKRLTLRHHWHKQIGNDGYVTVSVPASFLAGKRKAAGTTRRRDSQRDSHGAPGSVPIEAIRTLEKAIDTLAKQLEEERTRTADAQADGRVARDEAAGLRAELDARKQWGLWRRVRGR